MPRSPTIFTLPPGTTPQIPNTTIQSAVFNAAMDDIAQTFNTAQPVVYGGTGGTTPAQARENLGAAPYGIVDAKTANYTVLVEDDGNVLAVSASGGSRTIDLPPAATAGNGFKIIVKKTDSSVNTVTIDGDGTETIDGALTRVLRLQNQSVALICDGSNWLVMDEGTVFRSGVNSDGHYIRFAGGVQICWHTMSFGAGNNAGSGTLSDMYRSSLNLWQFPVPFIDTTWVLNGTPRMTSTGATGFVTFSGPTLGNKSAAGASQMQTYRGTNTATNVIVELSAIGEWF